MLILKYFAVVGSVLAALLFVADATMEKHGPMPFNSEFAGMPKPWRAEAPSILAATPAPEPDMTSEAVLAAAPPALPQVAEAAAAKAEAIKVETAPAPKKAKRVMAHKQPPRQDDDWRTYALRNGGDNGLFGGNFGRF